MYRIAAERTSTLAAAPKQAVSAPADVFRVGADELVCAALAQARLSDVFGWSEAKDWYELK